MVNIAKHTLQLPTLEEGLALPCLQTYYIASQLANVHWCFFPEANNATTALEAAILTSYESLQNITHRMSLRGREGVNVVATILWIFRVSKLLPPSTQAIYSPNAPLWGNPCLLEFYQKTDGGSEQTLERNHQDCNQPLDGTINWQNNQICPQILPGVIMPSLTP